MQELSELWRGVVLRVCFNFIFASLMHSANASDCADWANLWFFAAFSLSPGSLQPHSSDSTCESKKTPGKQQIVLVCGVIMV